MSSNCNKQYSYGQWKIRGVCCTAFFTFYSIERVPLLTRVLWPLQCTALCRHERNVTVPTEVVYFTAQAHLIGP